MDRREFLKSLSIIPASVVVANSALAVALNTTATGLQTLISPNIGDIVITETEILPYEFVYLYRGLAYLKQYPDNKKYFSCQISNIDIVASDKFKHDMYVQLIGSFL